MLYTKNATVADSCVFNVLQFSKKCFTYIVKYDKINAEFCFFNIFPNKGKIKR